MSFRPLLPEFTAGRMDTLVDDYDSVPDPVTAPVMRAVPARAACSDRMHTATAAPHARFGQVRIISMFSEFRCAVLYSQSVLRR